MLGTLACGELTPLPLPIDGAQLHRVLDDRSLLFTGQSNAAAAAYTPAAEARAQLYNQAALRTWQDGWQHGDASKSGHKPPGVGLLAGALGWLLEEEYQLPVALLGQPQPAANIAWMAPAGDNYNMLLDRVVASGSRPAVLLWHQGESDGIEHTSEQQYRQALNELIAAWRSDFVDLQYIVVFLTSVNACGYDQSQVRAAQRAVAAMHDDVLLVDADALTGTAAHLDGCHYDWMGYEAQAMLALHAISFPPR